MFGCDYTNHIRSTFVAKGDGMAQCLGQRRGVEPHA
jgi:hypothetical protein